MNPFSRAFPLLTLLAVAAGQNEAARPADKPAKAPFVFEPGTVELRTLIERCGTYLHRNILAEDSELFAAVSGGRKAAPPRPAVPAVALAAAEPAPGPIVELQLPVVTDRNGCEEMLASLLWARGLALVPLDEPKGVYEVLAMGGPRAREITQRAVPRTPEEVLARPTLRQWVTVVQPLKHTNANVATNALRPFFANSGNQGIQLGTAGNSTSLLLSGPQDQVANAIVLLRAADVPQPPEARTDTEMRLEALTKQNEQLLKRLATLEEKVGNKQ